MTSFTVVVVLVASLGLGHCANLRKEQPVAEDRADETSFTELPDWLDQAPVAAASEGNYGNYGGSSYSAPSYSPPSYSPPSYSPPSYSPPSYSPPSYSPPSYSPPSYSPPSYSAPSYSPPSYETYQPNYGYNKQSYGNENGPGYYGPQTYDNYGGFQCAGKKPAFYGDAAQDCKVFYICQSDGRTDSFRCPKWTRFNNYLGICDWHFKVDNSCNPLDTYENNYQPSYSPPSYSPPSYSPPSYSPPSYSKY